MGTELPSGPIAITGMHRSGTSMVTRALHDAGLHLVGSGAEELIDAAEDNPEGFWENKAIVQSNEALLEASGGAWDNPPDLPPQAVDDPRLSHLAEGSTAALAALSGHDHWGFKDPRTCLTAAYWLDLEPDLRFIICVRNPLEVALSLKRRNQNSYSLGLALWERYYTTVIELVPTERRIITHYDTFFIDPEGEIARVCAFAGLEPAAPRVRSDLRHHTIGVGLGEAGVSDRARALYVDLCREAGAPLPPESTPDEGRVRRLILDGAVAQRHADQRQAAIERLQEREVKLRQRTHELEIDRGATEAKHREQVRNLESRLAAVRQETSTRMEALQVRTADALRRLTESADRTSASVAEIDRRTRTVGFPFHVAVRAVDRGVVGRVARRAVRAGRQLVVRLESGDQDDGWNRLAPRARAVAHQVPSPIQQPLRRARHLLRRGAAEPAPTAKAVARRLPPSVQQVLRRGRRLASRLQQEGVVPVLRADHAPRAAAPPKGPALRQWKQGYEQMVAAIVPEGEPWLVITPGSPKEVRNARTPRATPYPATRDGRPFADDLAHIAHLEAARFGGHRHLVLPEGSRPWFRQQAELRDHVVRTYRTVVDEAGAGAVFDLAAAAVEGARSLRGEVSRLGAGLPAPPAVLDWTELGVAAELPGLATFRPPAGARLPYLDSSVDIVVVDAAQRLDDARRVASLGVITVGAGASGVEVRAVEGGPAGPAPAARRVLVWSSGAGTGDPWEAHLAERASAAGADLRIATIEPGGLARCEDHDVVVVVEPHVLPLPGTIEVAATMAAAQPGTAIAGKVLRADGRLEAAGGTVFSDRSVAPIAGLSAEVRAPWHDYVRPVCWAPGLVAAATSLWTEASVSEPLTGRPFLREWCAAVWAKGGAVLYQPTVTAVRVAGDGSEASVPLHSSSWQRVLDLRPARPTELGDGAWRYLLARDDVEACRG